jgi:ArsR family metal-binding transcriptional regulator
MKKFLFIISLIFILSPDLFAQEKKDTLFFTNGTRVIGILKKVKVGIVTFDPDWANDITVQLKRINTINAGREIYRVESTKKQVYFGVQCTTQCPDR